jgi:Amt family ammonium transporter
VVHSTGGWVTLAALLIIGARHGRFPKDGPPQKISPASMPLATLGVLLLWVGWFGFNGGSVLAFNDQVPRVLGNTLIASCAGLMTGILIGWLIHKQSDIGLIFNGTLAALVAITAGAFVVSTRSAIVIGIMGAIIMYGAERLLERLHVDDAIGVVPVHLAAGIWGTLAVGLFGQAELLATNLSRAEQVGVQLTGIVTCFVWGFGASYIILKGLNYFYPLRVSAHAEQIGLNVSEHGASTELFDLFSVMDAQSKTGDLSLRVPADPFTEVGQIAQRYNQVMEGLEEAVNRTNAIIHTAGDAIITFSTIRLEIRSANPAAEALFGYAQAQFVDQPFTQLIALETSNLSIADMVREGKYYEFLGQHRTGKTFPLEVAITQAKSGGQSFYVALARDISSRKEAERALADARDQALEASRLKSEFLAIVGHELRTPLNAIMGMAELVETGIYGNISPEQQNALQRIIGSSERLTLMVNELLDQAQLDAGTMKISKKPFSLKSILEQIQYSLGVLAAAKGLTLTTNINDDFPPILMGDPNRINQILTNLIGNAIKFTDEGQVNVLVGKRNPFTWYIKVRDTGPGLSKDAQHFIFEAFRQVEDPVTRDHGGIGLGLSITQKLAILMGGDVSVKSELGKGSEFTVVLPLITEPVEVA